ncbi:MAG: arginine--tRNA ligase [Hyphomicrobiales bacterium]
MNLFDTFKEVVAGAVAELVGSGALSGVEDMTNIGVEPPRDATHGDISTNGALVLAKQAKMKPRDIAELLVPELQKHQDIEVVDIAGPGFINIKLVPGVWPDLVKTIVSEGADYGRSDIGKGERVNVEYVSANPTGPLHVGHCRGGIFGDALARLLTAVGYDVDKEYYFNDAGVQIDVLAKSAYLRYREACGEDIGEIPSGLYPGIYLKKLGAELATKYGDKFLNEPEDVWMDIIRQDAVAFNMAAIKDDLAALNITHDILFNESSLHVPDNEGLSKIDRTLEELRARDIVYEGHIPAPKGQPVEDWEDREQTLFRAENFGDEMDRPLAKSDGSYTYFAADVAYFRDKYERGYKKMIFVLGADHGGYVRRLEAVCDAISGGEAEVVVLINQLVKLFRAGEPVRMSKRAGEFVTLRDVVDEVGSDVVRFMMLYRKNEAPLDFDFVKVTEQSRDNPVFYVQYAHARICSVFGKVPQTFPQLDVSQNGLLNADFSCLQDDAERAVMRKLAEYPRIISSAATHYEPHRIAFYLYDLAGEFHALWNKGKELPQLRFIREDSVELTTGRLALLAAIRYVLANGLKILGVKPVEEM